MIHRKWIAGAWAVALGLSAIALGQSAPPGKSIFKTHCVLCHGADGASNTAIGKQLKAPDLRSAEVQSKTDAELTQVITHGQNSMPAFDDKLSAAEIGDVLKYVRELGKTKSKLERPSTTKGTENTEE